MEREPVYCKIEHHAVLFAYLARRAIELCGEAGREAILSGMTTYGNERGKRMAKNALAHGDALTTMANQAYGEWKPDYDGQMEFGQLRTEPTLQTYISKCAWCDAWKKHGLTEYGKLYCVNVDNAVYQGFRPDFVCTPISTAMSWGGERCEFDWGYPLTPDEVSLLADKKKELGASCMKDFNFHTAHLKHTISKTLIDTLGEKGKKAVELACQDFTHTFGPEYLEVLEGIYPPADVETNSDTPEHLDILAEICPPADVETNSDTPEHLDILAEICPEASETQPEENIIADWITSHEEELIQTADYIFRHPEPAYHETLSSECLADFLTGQGFWTEKKTAGIDTAFTAEWGAGKPVLGFLAEYDALPELGHACGHNLLGTGATAAACALKAYMESRHIPGTIRVYGCPAEEIMSGKILMNRRGVFNDLDVAITWHPFDRNRVSNDIWQAQDIKNYTFHGISAHASRSPEDGRSALDAAELMNIGVNYLREHVPGDVRMHYAYADNGQPANVVPDYARTNYFIRSASRSRTDDASRRVDDCAKGAALMTGTTVEIELISSCKEMKVNRVLAEIYYQAMTNIPTPVYTDEEIAFAAGLTQEAGFPEPGDYFTGLEPLEATPVPISIGTDASEVSHTVPLITISAATMCKGTPLHHWTAAKQAGMSIGHKGMLYAARCMAEGSKLLIENPENLRKAWDFHRKEGI